MAAIKQARCNACGNEKLFVAVFTLEAECIVDHRGEEVEGINSPISEVSLKKHCDSDFETSIQIPHKCAICGSNSLKIHYN